MVEWPRSHDDTMKSQGRSGVDHSSMDDGKPVRPTEKRETRNERREREGEREEHEVKAQSSARFQAQGRDSRIQDSGIGRKWDDSKMIEGRG